MNSEGWEATGVLGVLAQELKINAIVKQAKVLLTDINSKIFIPENASLTLLILQRGKAIKMAFRAVIITMPDKKTRVLFGCRLRWVNPFFNRGR